VTTAKEQEKPTSLNLLSRDNIEALTMAIIMAVMLKYFLVEAYKIPTGSMQPTLMGNEDTGVFDRIIVDKFSYHYRDPERFEVAVFKYPLNRAQNFIKRVCGMPGEYFSIRDGDLWSRPDEKSEWKILRRPRSVQQEVWKRLDPADPRLKDWRPLGATKWTSEGRAKITARGDGAVRLPSDAGPVLDNYRDGYPGSMGTMLGRNPDPRRRRFIPPGTNPVGDLRIEGQVTALPGCTKVAIEFSEGPRKHVLEIPGPAAAADALIRITSKDDFTGAGPQLETVKTPAWKLTAGKKISFAAQNMDDLLQLEIDGDIVATLEIPGTSDQAAAFTLRVEGEGADFDSVELFRDIYYTSGTKGREFKIPPGHYVMLGDNTQDSSDSREWQLTSYRLPDGTPEGTKVRGNWYRPQNPLEVLGEPEGKRIFFRDEWGELHNFLEKDAKVLPLEDAPYVPRNLIVGRAVIVFWPWPWVWPGNWGDDQVPMVTRLKWVH
jgi:signal peptidase I